MDVVDAFDHDLLLDTLQKLKEGKNVEVPIYDFKTHSRYRGLELILLHDTYCY